MGLDPTYLERADPQRWTRWVAITNGELARPAEAVHSVFEAAYVVSHTLHEQFAAQADADPGLRLVYRDDHSLVWEVVAAAPEMVTHDFARPAGYPD